MITEEVGFTESERYLSKLCKQSFLSLWSFTNVFTEPAKELCGALVIVGNKVLIFSDKQCQFNNAQEVHISWQRWFSSAIEKSARQLWGARRSIETNRK